MEGMMAMKGTGRTTGARTVDNRLTCCNLIEDS